MSGEHAAIRGRRDTYPLEAADPEDRIGEVLRLIEEVHEQHSRVCAWLIKCDQRMARLERILLEPRR